MTKEIMIEWKLNEANQVLQGTVLLEKGEPTQVLLLVLKGRVAVYDENIKYTVGTGCVLGLTDMEETSYRATYQALEPTIVMARKNNGRVFLREFLSKNSNTCSTVALVTGWILFEYRKLYQSLMESAKQTYQFLQTAYSTYMEPVSGERTQVQSISAMETLKPYAAEFDKLHGKEAEYYLSAARISPELQKKYFASSAAVTTYYICEGAKLQQLYTEECGKLMQYHEQLLHILMSSREDCLFKRISKRLLYFTQFGNKNQKLSDLLEDCLEQINGLEDLIEKNKQNAKLPDRDAMERMYYSVISGEVKNDHGVVSAEQIMQETENLTEKLLDFAQADEQLRESVLSTLQQFRSMKNKTATDDRARALRREIYDWFFKLYETIFMREYKLKTGEKYISLFLDYGVVDEALLSQEEMMELYYLENPDESGQQYAVYTMTQWLTAVYEGRKNPSKNEFNMDYEEFLRDMKKNNNFSSMEEEIDYRENPARKLEFELKNLFRMNSKVLSGQPVVAVPFLHSEALQGTGIHAMRLTSEKIAEAFEKIRSTDVTLFARERMYAENTLQLARAYVVETVFPEMILFPMSGNNTVMWQEVSGKRKNTPARFLFPILFFGTLENVCLRLAGQFRWELVRTIQGMAWNDLSNKCLTSEYADYIQFYRKNRDLSEERKEKLKIQIVKCRNNLREIFTEDYQVWIRSESSGAMRLTKPAREIMAMYCPFAKEVRQKLSTQPAFEGVLKRYASYVSEKQKEIAYVMREYEKQNVPLPDLVAQTKRFYDET